MKDELETVIEENTNLCLNLDEQSRIIQDRNRQLKRTSSREIYWREKCQKLNYDERIYTEDDMITKHMTIAGLEKQVKDKNKQIKELNERLSELEVENCKLKKTKEAIIFDEESKTYSTDAHLCVYSLLNCNVAFEQIGQVMSAVLNLVNIQPNKLPSVGTIHNWSIERGLISKKQTADLVTKENTTLHSDETSKYGTKWGAFATRDDDGCYTLLGLQEMATKSSDDTLDTFKNILKDIESVSSDGVGNKILFNIKNTMSDRASTEKKFNELLKDYRNSILPEVFNNYDSFCEEEKIAYSKMNNFFCGLHTLVHLAETAQKTLLETEKLHFNNDIPKLNKHFDKPSQPGTIRLIHTSCKAFARRGDAKNGCHSNFLTFLSDTLKKEKMSFPLQPLKGNRFNILFTNAGQIYYFLNHMCEFLDKTPNLNLLLASVLHDLKEDFFVAGCKALGLVSKLITTPFWNVLENNEISISMFNDRLIILADYLKHASSHIEDFICGKMMLYDDVPVKEDKIYKYLLESSEIDKHVIVILSVMLPAFAQLIKNHYKEHLPGGALVNLNLIQTKSVDKHNKFPERVFSYVDHLLSCKPNINTITMESHITFSLNKTSEWLAEHSNAHEIITQSRKEVKNEKIKFKQREENIHAKRLEKQLEDFKKKENMERRRIAKLEKETLDMTFYGL
ncbi:uncharacterized protein LOC127840695 [Dreissena polymorpha]|uniref:uncharacterized protein LOC127840695 n=1 Tax=Dreissena polymorpha TaxID=45954 RepID=UPI0022644E47|nr:uncharacterized protein LOC127840695 [Dreissena polymorpha]